MSTIDDFRARLTSTSLAAMRRIVRDAGARYARTEGGWVLADHPNAYDALGRVVPYPLEEAYDEVLRASRGGTAGSCGSHAARKRAIARRIDANESSKWRSGRA
ncbi:MAG: hypothetical protein NT062_25105 [Proteobacteria bacterium]|nr:hypothetical protein [Pseudomonadota bacterium]